MQGALSNAQRLAYVLAVDSFLFSWWLVAFLQQTGLRGQRFDLAEQGGSYLLVDTDDSHNIMCFGSRAKITTDPTIGAPWRVMSGFGGDWRKQVR